MENQIFSPFLEIVPCHSHDTAMKFIETSNWDLKKPLHHHHHHHHQHYLQELMFSGSFEEAKVAATAQDKWLLVNLQSSKDKFDSHKMNQDLWSDEIVKSCFLFWQAQDLTVEGMKVCTYYKLDSSFPVSLVIDPITGQNMMCLSKPEYLLMNLLHPFMEISPKYNLRGVPFRSRKRKLEGPYSQSSMIEEKKKKKEEEVYPPLPADQEPKCCDRNLVCRVAVRLPDGRRFHRSFLREDPIELLWSLCYYEIEESKNRPFGLRVAIPGASKRLDYAFDGQLTFEKSGISNSIISLTWE